MIGIKIEAGVDELPADGSKCNKCKEVIEGTMFIMYVQVGEPTEATSFPAFCEKCFKELGD